MLKLLMAAGLIFLGVKALGRKRPPGKVTETGTEEPEEKLEELRL